MRASFSTLIFISLLSPLVACKPRHHMKSLSQGGSTGQSKVVPQIEAQNVAPDYQGLSAPYIERFTVDTSVEPSPTLLPSIGSAALPIEHTACLNSGTSSFHAVEVVRENVYPQSQVDLTTDFQATSKKLSDDTVEVDTLLSNWPAYSYSVRYAAPGADQGSVSKDLAGKAKPDSTLPYECYDGLTSTDLRKVEGGYVLLADATKSAATRVTKSVLSKAICRASGTTKGVRTLVVEEVRSTDVQIFAHEIARANDPCAKGAIVLSHVERRGGGRLLRLHHYELLGTKLN